MYICTVYVRLSTLRGSFKLMKRRHTYISVHTGEKHRRSVLQPHFQLNRWTFSRCVTHFHPSMLICFVHKALSSNTNQQRITCNPLRLQQGCRVPCNLIWFVHAFSTVHICVSSASGRSKSGIRMATRPRRMKHCLPALDRLKRKTKQTKCVVLYLPPPRRFLQIDNCSSLVHSHPPTFLHTCPFMSIYNCPPLYIEDITKFFLQSCICSQ